MALITRSGVIWQFYECLTVLGVAVMGALILSISTDITITLNITNRTGPVIILLANRLHQFSFDCPGFDRACKIIFSSNS